MRAIKKKEQVAATATRREWFQSGLGGAISRRHALQALASIGTVRQALGQSRRGRPRDSFRTGLTVVGEAEGERGAVHGLTLKAADGRQRRTRGFAVGETVEVCFGTSEAGFVSLWSMDAEGVLDRLVPNRYTPEGSEGFPVREGQTYCVSGDGRLTADDGATVHAGTGKYRLEVREPVGQSELLLYWTHELEQQPEAELAVDIDALDNAIEKRRSGSGKGKYRGRTPPRETLTFEFEIVREVSQ